MIKDNISKKNLQTWIFVGLLIVAISPSVLYASEAPKEAAGSTVIGVLWPSILGWIIAIAVTFKRAKIGVLISGLGGLFLSSYLSWQHITKSDASACKAGELFNCAKVNTSKFGYLSGHLEFLPDLPLAFLGFAFYGAVLVLTVSSLSDDSEEESAFSGTKQILSLVSGISILFSVYLAYISKSVAARRGRAWTARGRFFNSERDL